MDHEESPPGANRRALESVVRNGRSETDYSAASHRLQASCLHLHRLGPRPLYEFVVELVTAFGPEVVDRIEAYRCLDLALLRTLGADRFPPRMAAINGGRP